MKKEEEEEQLDSFSTTSSEMTKSDLKQERHRLDQFIAIRRIAPRSIGWKGNLDAGHRLMD